MMTCPIEYRQGGIHLPSLDLWLDPHRAQKGPERVLVSHAHSDHLAAHREIIVSEPTAQLLRVRLPGRRLLHPLPFGQATPWPCAATHYRLTLLPAGHILGSAMAYLETDHGSLLYTGDFKLRPGRAVEPCAPRPADVLIMETTFGRPQYEFPPIDEVLAAIIRFCHETLDQGATPVLLGYSLGKCQALLQGLSGAQLPLMLQDQVLRLTRIYEQCGQRFPPYEALDPDRARGHVLICPPGARQTAWRERIGPVRSAFLTGWAVDPRLRYRLRADAAFPLSDHADFPELLELVRQVAPRRVYTCHGFAADFAATLRDLGLDARALSEPDQLRLPLRFAPEA